MAALQTSPGVEVSRPGPLPSVTMPAAAPGASSMSPALPGSYAPDPATAAPTLVSTPVPPAATIVPPAATIDQPTAPLPTLALPTIVPQSNEERWRAQQIERSPFEGPRPYFTTGTELWWYDPVNQQSVILGRITGDFLGQAQFTLRGQGMASLEVPYQVNVSYGLTALSPVVLERIRAAGYTEWIETYVFLTPDVIAR